MADFSPIFPAHAVERCAVSFAFRPPVPEKAFQRIREKAHAVMAARGLRPGPSPTGININPATGQITPITGGPSLFISDDGQTQILIAPEAISITTNQYLRWANMRAQVESVLKALQSEYSDIVNLFAFKVEYWDRFNWNGDWANFDVSKLLTATDLVNARARVSEREWHSHAGWFTYLDGFRRLTNVNVDVQGLVHPGAGDQPTVGIYTMLQDEAYGAAQELFEQQPLLPRTDELHNELKDLLSAMLAPEIAHRIGLKKGRA
jgi:uncharacterized protein (TIGR04255 family)